ncbi:M48 family metallopeptidase [Paludisphaera rhizosphaerae]|uniref:M48 family metallopeptidase n=1 Tax=Paludisphaera rhizosphaerae TaxID=2711216 RepID=UPI0013ED955A|nr:M48 family metallopeptidase [Paludisphaera rhizosphaerae]
MDDVAREASGIEDEVMAEGLATGEADRSESPTAFTPEEVRASFRGAIPHKGLPASYRLWAFVVACVMVTLPLIYVGIVAAAVYAMYWHATHNYTVFQTVRNGKGAVMAYFGPLIVLGTVVFFLAKPLFAGRAKPPRKRGVTREEEPALYELVDGVCKSVGAPRPVRIDVDCQLNASAGPENGLFSLLRKRLVLTIGLPMAAVFDADQFAGVLAHEFGHFAQSTGMKLTYVIRSINAWFARVVYERDAWDQSLVEFTNSGNIYTLILGNLARLLVWLSRRILWVLMYTGHAVSCTMSRQMEFDADRCEAYLAGSHTSAGATRRLRLGGLANAGAMSDLSECWKEGRLPDDLPRLVEANIPQVPEAGLKAIDDALAHEKTKVFDTHPADRDRIAAVLALHAPGVFHIEGPATAFFRDFDALSRSATAEHYEGLLGEAVDPARLLPYREVVRRYEDRVSDSESMKRVCVGTLNFTRPLPLPAEPAAVDEGPEAVRAELERLRNEQAAGRIARDELATPDQEAFNRRIQAQAAAAMLGCGYRIKPADYNLPSATADAAHAVVAEVDRAVGERATGLDEFDALAARRITLALGLLEQGDFAATIEGGETLRDEARPLLPLASTLASRVWPHLRSTVAARNVLLTVLGCYQKDDKNANLHRAIMTASADLQRQLVELYQAIGEDLEYPFAHAKGKVSLAEFALPGVPNPDDVGPLLQVSEHAADRLVPLYYRILGRLAVIVERVETALGLSRLVIEDQSGHNHA